MDEAPDPRTRGLSHVREGGVEPENPHARSGAIRRPERKTDLPLPPVDSRFLGGVHPRGAPTSLQLSRLVSREGHRSRRSPSERSRPLPTSLSAAQPRTLTPTTFGDGSIVLGKLGRDHHSFPEWPDLVKPEDALVENRCHQDYSGSHCHGQLQLGVQN